jgi:hypothetical protein
MVVSAKVNLVVDTSNGHISLLIGKDGANRLLKTLKSLLNEGVPGLGAFENGLLSMFLMPKLNNFAKKGFLNIYTFKDKWKIDIRYNKTMDGDEESTSIN